MARTAKLKDGHAVALSLLVAKRRLNSWRVSGTSMLPHVFPGDVCEISPIGTARIGDVAVYILEDCLVMHRIIAIRDGHIGPEYRFRGDNLSVTDPAWVPEKFIVGRLAGIKHSQNPFIRGLMRRLRAALHARARFF